MTLVKYLESKSSTISALSPLASLLNDGTANVGLILTERLINMPPKVITPLFSMLLEEIAQAAQTNSSYNFTHYLVVSKSYKEVTSQLDQEDRKSSKKAKKTPSNDTFYFHPEDEIFQRYSAGFGNFDYTSQRDEGQADSKRAFWDVGIMPQGHLMLFEKAQLEQAVPIVKEFLDADN
jgi:protein BCP1